MSFRRSFAHTLSLVVLRRRMWDAMDARVGVCLTGILSAPLVRRLYARMMKASVSGAGATVTPAVSVWTWLDDSWVAVSALAIALLLWSAFEHGRKLRINCAGCERSPCCRRGGEPTAVVTVPGPPAIGRTPSEPFAVTMAGSGAGTRRCSLDRLSSDIAMCVLRFFTAAELMNMQLVSGTLLPFRLALVR